jgi:Mg2+ and Co2+ transporter CorA
MQPKQNAGKEGDCWDALRDNLLGSGVSLYTSVRPRAANRAPSHQDIINSNSNHKSAFLLEHRPSYDRRSSGPHDLRRQPCVILFYALLNTTLLSCDDIDVSFGYIIENLTSLTDHIHGSAPGENKKTAISLKREMSTFCRRVVPLREAFRQLAHDSFPSTIIPPQYRVFFQDLADGSQRVMDNIQLHYDDSVELQRKLEDLDSNNAAKVQFIISMALAFFSPLSFIVGLYGMNFSGDPETGTGGIPELTWKDGYTFVWLLMMSVILAIICVFFYLGIIPLPYFCVRQMAIFNRKHAKRR